MEVEVHFSFIDEVLSKAAPEVENAIYVSFLENIFIGSADTRYGAARLKLSQRLRTALESLEAHWADINKWLAKERSDS